MNTTRDPVLLSDLSEFSRLMPRHLPRERVFDALRGLSIECSFTYSLGRSFLPDGWVIEYNPLQVPSRLRLVHDLLLFVTSGTIRFTTHTGQERYVHSGEQIMLRASSETLALPVAGAEQSTFISLSQEPDLARVLQACG